MATSKSKSPLILITNDDGITSPGIECLVNVAKRFGRVVVVAPDAPQSAMGHAITIGKPLRLNKVHTFGPDIEAYQCSGTPVDCVKLAVDVVLKERPTLCLSGINHGSNASINVIYSGTMSAAMEASIEGIPSVGFSLLNYSWDANFETSAYVVAQVLNKMLVKKWHPNTLFNVNIPDLPIKKLKGFKICRQAKAKWKESFVARKDPMGKTYYWLTGQFVNMDKRKDTDIEALNKGYVSIVPTQSDLTDYSVFESLKNNWD